MQLREPTESFVPPATTDLGTADLAAPISDDRRGAIAGVCLHAVLATAAGPYIDPQKLSAFIDGRLDQLYDGRHFDFAPVLRALLKIEGVSEHDLYVGIVNLIGQLSAMDVIMEEPRMSLDAATRRRLLDMARAATETARATFERRRLRAAVAKLDRKRLGDLLVEAQLIGTNQLVAALAAQEQHGGRLGTNLIEMGFVEPSDLAHFLSSQLELPCVTAIGQIERDVLDLVPPELAARHKVFPIELKDDAIVLAMADPANLAAIEDVERLSGRVVRPSVAPELVITYALARYYQHRQPTRIRVHAVAPRIPATRSATAYGLHELAGDFARADDHLDILAMAQRYMMERYAASAVFDVADGVVHGFSAAGVEGANDIRSRFVASDGELPEDEWFVETLGLDEAPVHVIGIRSDEDDLVAILVGAHPNATIPSVELHRLAALTASALRMVELREAILMVADS
ncbi:MAG: hypothetical protein RMA76_35765 [Deltaproteobacteria bacterium]